GCMGSPCRLWDLAVRSNCLTCRKYRMDKCTERLPCPEKIGDNAAVASRNQQKCQARSGLSGNFGIIRQSCCYPAVAAVLACTECRISNGSVVEGCMFDFDAGSLFERLRELSEKPLPEDVSRDPLIHSPGLFLANIEFRSDEDAHNNALQAAAQA